MNETPPAASIFDYIQSPSPTSDDTNSDGIFAELSVDDSWGTGFVARGSIINDSGAAVNGWSLAVSTEAEIENIWNAQILSNCGDTYIIGNMNYNEYIAEEESVDWGFQAAGDDILEFADVII